jgi:hypothetical protein
MAHIKMGAAWEHKTMYKYAKNICMWNIITLTFIRIFWSIRLCTTFSLMITLIIACYFLSLVSLPISVKGKVKAIPVTGREVP